MIDKHYIDLEPKDQDRRIYRIISVDRLCELFKVRQNVLVRPQLWDDPFENFILNSLAQFPNGKTGAFEYHDHFYGQCRTLHSASDAMWHIYSPDSRGVRIRTTIRCLAKSLSRALRKSVHSRCFIGKVQYLKKREMTEFANTVFAKGIDPISLARTLLVKRRAFSHEKEVRLLYFENKNKKGNDLFRYGIDPAQFIDQIMIDPRFPQDEFKKLKRGIQRQTNFPIDRIKRSLLYGPPARFVIPVGAVNISV